MNNKWLDDVWGVVISIIIIGSLLLSLFSWNWSYTGGGFALIMGLGFIFSLIEQIIGWFQRRAEKRKLRNSKRMQIERQIKRIKDAKNGLKKKGKNVEKVITDDTFFMSSIEKRLKTVTHYNKKNTQCRSRLSYYSKRINKLKKYKKVLQLQVEDLDVTINGLETDLMFVVHEEKNLSLGIVFFDIEEKIRDANYCINEFSIGESFDFDLLDGLDDTDTLTIDWLREEIRERRKAFKFKKHTKNNKKKKQKTKSNSGKEEGSTSSDDIKYPFGEPIILGPETGLPPC